MGRALHERDYLIGTTVWMCLWTRQPDRIDDRWTYSTAEEQIKAYMHYLAGRMGIVIDPSIVGFSAEIVAALIVKMQQPAFIDKGNSCQMFVDF